ncbi:pseudouridine synthase [Scatolibacter rhodanostii]|uniref:pseudouridine synthase n=1 Tax=Scatolibacter rhodanostii TaxID=2014781 RepID=UPI000C06EAE7|nr:pseudouridine synthase [Scatolibacter rhodanostii]
MAEQIRLQKVLAECGVASRRKSEELIITKRVRVNGKLAEIGDKVTKKDVITVDGEAIQAVKEKVYLALHKPRGFVTTMQDEKGRKCVASLVENLPGRIYPVGRLDKDSEGLLLMTNDGDFANKIMHPANHIPKTYRVTVRPSINEDQLNKIATGIMIDNQMTLPAKVKVLQEEPGRVVLEIVLHEGRNREIRKMCEAIGLEVARLKRITVGPVRLGMLQQGSYRELTKEEMRILAAEVKKGEKNADDNHSSPKRQTKGRRYPSKKRHS